MWRRALFVLPAVLASVIGTGPVAHAADGDGRILPPTATPFGISLTEMTRLSAAFQTSGGDLRFFPHTPLQVLFTQSQDVEFRPVAGGTLILGSREFTFPRGTTMWVPLFSATDSAPVLGTFPRTHAQAVRYIVDKAAFGANNVVVVIDGAARTLGPGHITGPVTKNRLRDCTVPADCGTHLVMDSAFIDRLPVGTHTIEVYANFNGAFFTPFIREHLTYTVTITG